MATARVVELRRYPVKSMAVEELEAAAVGWHGLEGDRRWAFVRPGLERSDFPWLTMRQRSDLGQFRPRIAGDERTLVRTPDGGEFDVTDPALAAALGDGVRVIGIRRGIYDVAPVSLISTATIAAIARAAEVPADPRRFRPNLVVDAGDEPFQEDAWVGRTLRIGGAEIRIDQRDQRCVMVDIDPDTAERRPGVLRTLAELRASCAGVYGTPVTPGAIRVGDAVELA